MMQRDAFKSDENPLENNYWWALLQYFAHEIASTGSFNQEYEYNFLCTKNGFILQMLFFNWNKIWLV